MFCKNLCFFCFFVQTAFAAVQSSLPLEEFVRRSHSLAVVQGDWAWSGGFLEGRFLVESTLKGDSKPGTIWNLLLPHGKEFWGSSSAAKRWLCGLDASGKSIPHSSNIIHKEDVCYPLNSKTVLSDGPNFSPVQHAVRLLLVEVSAPHSRTFISLGQVLRPVTDRASADQILNSLPPNFPNLPDMRLAIDLRLSVANAMERLERRMREPGADLSFRRFGELVFRYFANPDPIAMQVLSRLATDPKRDVPHRRLAVYALQRIRTEHCLPALIQLLNDQDEHIVQLVISGIAGFANDRSVPKMPLMEEGRIIPRGAGSGKWETPETLAELSQDFNGNKSRLVNFWKQWWQNNQAKIQADH
jgi:hypothetical protein